MLLRTKPVPAWWIPLFDAFLILWRVLMCAVALWVVLTPAQTATLRDALASNALMQAKLDGLGEAIGRQLWLLGWEILLYIAAFVLLNLLLSLSARLWNRGRKAISDRQMNRQAAVAAVVRNLVLIPLGLIYIAVVVRDVVSENPHLT